MSEMPVLSIDEVECSFYIRLHVQDRTGVLADITRILSDKGISIEAMYQKDVDDNEPVPVVLMTHRIRESAMREALEQIAALEAVLDDIMRIRVETLDA